MRRPGFIARQSRCPSGFLGRLIAVVMSAETARFNEAVVDLLELEPTDHVLEIGFGHGRTVERVAASAHHGFVAGVDLSKLMVRMAKRRNRGFLRDGRVELRLGDSESLPYPDRRFDKAFAVHTLYFWTEPKHHLQEIHRVLKDGGLFVLGFTPREDRAAVETFPGSIYRFYSSNEIQTLLQECRFDSVRVERRYFGERMFCCAAGRRAASPHFNKEVWQ